MQEAIRSERGGPLPCKHAVWLWSGLVVEHKFYTTAQSKIHLHRLAVRVMTRDGAVDDVGLLDDLGSGGTRSVVHGRKTSNRAE